MPLNSAPATVAARPPATPPVTPARSLERVEFVTPDLRNSDATEPAGFSPSAGAGRSPHSRLGTLSPLGAAGLTASLAACGGGHVGTPGPNGTAQLSGLPGSGAAEPARSTSADQQPAAVDAARFLAQAGFGARSAAEVEALRAEGYEHWLWAQFNAPALRHTSYLDWQRQRDPELDADTDMSFEAIWQHWLGGADPLRARMVFALSQILVISNAMGGLPAYALSSYMDTLARHAFGNYREVLEAVTLHPAMGRFLNMMGSEKQNARTGAHPNENYAREFLQLFSVGLVQLAPDGTVRTGANGQPLPTYDETVVQGHARAFTGWSWPRATAFQNADTKDQRNWTEPMSPWPAFHTSSGDLMLVGGRTATASSPQADLALAIDAAFNHPNVGPFIGRQLIQRLVSSNPSPAYVARVAAVFGNNGAGVRGDLRAVTRAILLDPEARNPALRAAGRAGKLREPVLRLAGLLRALGASNPGGRNAIHALNSSDTSLGQSPLLAPSVFNFYSPAYQPPGVLASAGLVAPELQIATEASVPAGLNLLRRVLSGGGIGSGEGRLVLQLDPWLALAATPAALVAEIDAVFCNLQMSASLRQRLLDLIAAYPASRTRERLLAALTLTLLSPDHLVLA